MGLAYRRKVIPHVSSRDLGVYEVVVISNSTLIGFVFLLMDQVSEAEFLSLCELFVEVVNHLGIADQSRLYL